MIRPIMDKQFFLKQPSVEATTADIAIARDLAETLEAHRATCVGMAANMIGQRKRIIAVLDEASQVLTMFNPEIVDCKQPYNATEGCLSLPGERETLRYERITVSYQDEAMQAIKRSFKGRVAQAIQHEIDHCNGILI
ncbi:peptide deformylase [Denitrobacterium detoxificans]|uniref:Peptide deformylase n=1 Tax=Denitrobacterium detoxificans TaxID=79604 RepID=A0A172RXK1_9ACTN|nr:peptide deformylase [Denitrobacterium detoxificans]ANE22439.1 peptide deformylase [Denitrobacterium detoxificans]SEO81257.1 peptide deformylase [Denitrobacterium detoxificans]